MSVVRIDSAQRSCKGAAAGNVRYCSSTCAKASTIPLPTWRGGRENVVSGSTIENLGGVLIWRTWLVKRPRPPISLTFGVFHGDEAKTLFASDGQEPRMIID